MKIIKNPHFKKLHETNEFVVGHVFEDAYLINIKTQEEIYMGDFYGDPVCALMGHNNNWCVVGGLTLSIWRYGQGISYLKDSELEWVIKMRQKSFDTVELLVDYWSDKCSVWTLNISTLERHKILDVSVENDGYTEKLEW